MQSPDQLSNIFERDTSPSGASAKSSGLKSPKDQSQNILGSYDHNQTKKSAKNSFLDLRKIYATNYLDS